MSWIQFFNSNLVGSLAGTLIAGLITIKVMKKQIEYDQDTRKIEELEKFLKINAIFESHLNLVQYHLDEFNKLINEDDNMHGVFQEKTKIKSDQVKQIIDETLNELKNIKLMEVPFEIYHEYIAIIDLLKIIKLFNIFETVKLDNYKTDWIYMNSDYNNFESSMNRLKKVAIIITQFREKSEKELKDIQVKWNK